MTDLKYGRLDMFGFEVGPKTTMNDFEENIGANFFKTYCSKTTTFCFSLKSLSNFSNFSPMLSEFFEASDVMPEDITVCFKNNQLKSIRLGIDMKEEDEENNKEDNSAFCPSFSLQKLDFVVFWVVKLCGQSKTWLEKIRWRYDWGEAAAIKDETKPHFLMIEYKNK